MTSDTPPNEKAKTIEAEYGTQSDRAGDMDRIDAKATAPGTTLASFSHLDEKKILRKVSSEESDETWEILTVNLDGYPIDSHAGSSLPPLVPRP